MVDLWQIEHDPTNPWSPYYKKDKAEAAQADSASITVPIGKTTTVDIKVTLTEAGNVPLASAQKNDSTGLAVEKTGASTTTPAKKVKPGPTFETQIKKVCELSDEKWNALSDEQKQEKADYALKKMIDDYNDDKVRIWNDISDAKWKKMTAEQKQQYTDLAKTEIDPKTGKKKELVQMTVAEQHELYVGRCTTKEGIARLAKSVKAMGKKDQLEAFRNSLNNIRPEFRDIAESIFAVDYVDLDKENIVSVTVVITNDFSEKNQVTAAQNAHKAPVETQVGVVEAFAKDGCKPAQMEIASKPDLFGIKEDGTIDKQVQLDCFKTISTMSPYQDVTEMSASKIYTLCKENQVPATDIIIGTNNEGAILAAASQVYKCSEENQEIIKNSLLNTNYSEKVQTVFVQQEKEATQAIQEEVEESASTSSTSLKAETELKIAEIEEKIKTKQDITSDVEKLSDSQKIALLKQCPSAEVVKAMIDLGASTEILAHISVDTIKQVDYKKMTGAIINFLSDDVQQYIVSQCASSGSLNNISREYLKAGAKKVYDKAIEEQKKDVTLGQ